MAISKSVSERRARRLARKQGASVPPSLPGTGDAGMIPHEALTDPPDPGATDSMAAGGLPVVRGNSNKQPMSPQGKQTIAKVGSDLAKLGGPDEIIPSTAARTQQTAGIVARQTGAPITGAEPGLESHALGQLEGEDKSPEVKKFLADLIRKSPNQKIPGQGAMSGRPGESFNDFRTRALHTVLGLMQKLTANPTERIVVPTSTQVIKLVQAWIANGTPDDLSIDHGPMLKEDSGAPGEMERMFPTGEGKWELKPFSPASASAFPPGIYLLRHGETGSAQAQNASSGQRARAQLISHIRGGKYEDARAVAREAASRGHLSDDEIGTAIDEGLPTANDAQKMLPADLLAAVSAAGPAKRQELLPVLHQRFGDLSAVNTADQLPLRSHLGRIGYRAR